MIDIKVFKDRDFYRGVRLNGHAGFAEEGEDIVCAAVSVLAINALNSIEAFTEDKFTEDVREEDAYMEFMLQDPISQKSQLLMLSLVLGLNSVAEENNQYITLTLEEV